MTKLSRKKINKLDKLALRGKTLTKTEKYFPIFALLIVFITLFTVFIPSIKKVKQVNLSIEEAKKKLEAIKEQRRVFEEMEKEENKAQLEKQYLYAETYLPSSKPAMQVLINISKLSRMDGVIFSGLKLNVGKVKDSAAAKKEEDSQMKEFEINFSILGEKSKILEFITSLREISPMMKVTDLKTTFEDGSTVLDADLTVRVFYKDDPSVIPAVDKQIELLNEKELATLTELSNYLLAQDYFNTTVSEEYPGISYGVEKPFTSSEAQ